MSQAIAGAAIRRSAWLSAYALGMGLLESAVVVYLRELYYPDGFRLPLVLLPSAMVRIEIVREICTLVMLLAVAALAARDRLDGFFVFAFLFGVWDLVYYAGLKVFLGWPASAATEDVLFLIPRPWIAPVLAPVLISLLLVAGYAAHESRFHRNARMSLRGAEWGVAMLGGAVVILAFCWRSSADLTGAQPPGFPWGLFLAGLLTGAAPFARAASRTLRTRAV